MLVSVAIPLKCPRKLSAVLSANKIARVSPRTLIRAFPADTRSPSLTKIDISVRPTSSSTARAISRPAMTPSWRATKLATTRSVPETVATEVISSPPSRSSANARLIKSRSIMVFQPPDIHLSSNLFDLAAEQSSFSTDHLFQGNLHANVNHESLGG